MVQTCGSGHFTFALYCVAKDTERFVWPPHSPANQVVVIREKLAELYEFEQKWSRAAQMLSGIDLDSGISFYQQSPFLVTNSNQEVLNLQYKVCYARILDLKRKFLEAALRYYGICQIEQCQIGDE
uniref:Uncharacterized protein n=1 Tax=Aegilops tauschii TaxID=37682 RepID=R7W8K3_AEGTA